MSVLCDLTRPASYPLLWAHWGQKLLTPQLRCCGCPVSVKGWLWGLRTERKTVRGLPWWLGGKESAAICKRRVQSLVQEDPTCCRAAKPMHACVLSRFSRVRLSVTLWTMACQAPMSLGFSRQEYWSGLPFPSPACAPQLLSLCSRVWEPQLLEPAHPRACAPQ